jgi:Flp pilus assembly secretin CpaC
MKADFDDWMKEDPGVKKFGAARQVYSIGPGETVIMGGWSPNAGQRMLVFITPTMIDAAGNKLSPPFDAQSEIQIDAKFVEAPGDIFAKLGLQTLFTEQNSSTETVRCSDSEFRSYLNSIEQSAGANVLSSPRVTTALGCQAAMSVGDTRMIAGKNQHLGPSLNLLPTLSADGVSVDLTAIAQYSEAAAEAAQ